MKLSVAKAVCQSMAIAMMANGFTLGRYQSRSSFIGTGGMTSSFRMKKAVRPTTLSMTASGLRRVVVTGMGITSCLGNTLEDVTQSLHDCRSGITYCEEYAKLGIKSQLRGRPNISEEEFKQLIPRSWSRYCGENAKFAYIAMKNCIDDAELEPSQYEENQRCAGIIGQGSTSIPDITETVDAVLEGSKRWKNKVGPFRMRCMSSATSAVLTTAFKLQGPSWSISSACSTGAHCIGTGFELIQMDKADMAFCGAGESECWQLTAQFDCMGALSQTQNDTPTKASRAFDKDRDGFVIAGGGGILLLEELSKAKARGAKIYAEVVGYAANSDGFDMVAPSGIGGQRCMRLAIEDAKRNADDKKIDYINTHGTSTPVGDVAELNAIKTLFDELGYQPWVGSTKSLSGHALGAAGVHEAIYSLLMMKNDFLAESANIENLVDEAEGMNILTERKDGPIERIMSNSFGFGGTNCALIFDKYVE